MEYETDCGIVLTIDFDRIEAPDPGSGIMFPYVSEWWVSHVGKRKCPVVVSDWLKKRLDAEYIENEIVERYW